MATESDESPVLRAALILLAVFVLYVLSIGPVYRYTLYSSGYGVRMWRYYAYFPLEWVAGHCDGVRPALQWYIELWPEGRVRHRS